MIGQLLWWRNSRRRLRFGWKICIVWNTLSLLSLKNSRLDFQIVDRWDALVIYTGSEWLTSCYNDFWQIDRWWTGCFDWVTAPDVWIGRCHDQNIFIFRLKTGDESELIFSIRSDICSDQMSIGIGRIKVVTIELPIYRNHAAASKRVTSRRRDIHSDGFIIECSRFQIDKMNERRTVSIPNSRERCRHFPWRRCQSRCRRYWKQTQWIIICWKFLRWTRSKTIPISITMKRSALGLDRCSIILIGVELAVWWVRQSDDRTKAPM